MVGLGPGVSLDASDSRVEAARYRLLSLGYFLDVHLSVARGSKRGAVVLVVDVEERGTLVINELFPATSEATLFWGGADVSEMNFLGRGHQPGGRLRRLDQAAGPRSPRRPRVRLHVGIPPLGGPNGVGLSVTGLYNDGSEFYRTSGPDTDADPGRFIATRVRRAGGVLTAGKMLPHNLHVTAAIREEAVSATLPQGPLESRLAPALQSQTLPDRTSVPIDFMIEDGSSQVGTIAASLDYDTRSDPVLPRSGVRLALSAEVGTSLLGSSYSYVKTVFNGSWLPEDAARARAGLSPLRWRDRRRRPLLRPVLHRRSRPLAAAPRAGDQLLDPAGGRALSAARSPPSATTTTPADC